MGLENAEHDFAMELASVVRAQRHHPEALGHDLVSFLVSHHGGLRPEDFALTNHLADDTPNGWTSGERLPETTLPAGDGLRHIGARARNDDQPAGVQGLDHIDAL